MASKEALEVFVRRDFGKMLQAWEHAHKEADGMKLAQGYHNTSDKLTSIQLTDFFRLWMEKRGFLIYSLEKKEDDKEVQADSASLADNQSPEHKDEHIDTTQEILENDDIAISSILKKKFEKEVCKGEFDTSGDTPKHSCNVSHEDCLIWGKHNGGPIPRTKTGL